MLPGRSDDAVRNRWHRLEESRRHQEDLLCGSAAAVAPAVEADAVPATSDGAGAGEGSGVVVSTAVVVAEKESELPKKGTGGGYKCSRCGQPKKHHICLAPNNLSTPEQTRLRKGKPPRPEPAEPVDANAAGRQASAAHERPPAARDPHSQRPPRAHAPSRATTQPAPRAAALRVGASTWQVWTREEDEIILLSVAQIGPRWIEIPNRLPGRTDHAARNRYHRLQRFSQPAGEGMLMLPSGFPPPVDANGVAIAVDYSQYS